MAVPLVVDTRGDDESIPPGETLGGRNLYREEAKDWAAVTYHGHE